MSISHKRGTRPVHGVARAAQLLCYGYPSAKMAVGKMAFRSARSARSAPRDLASELKVAEESKDWLACLRITQDVVKYEADLALAAAKTLSAPKPKMSTAEASLHRQGSAIHEADEALAALSFLKPTSKLPVAEANFVRHVEEAGQRLGSNAAKLQHVRAYRQRSASIQCSANEASHSRGARRPHYRRMRKGVRG